MVHNIYVTPDKDKLNLQCKCKNKATSKTVCIHYSVPELVLGLYYFSDANNKIPSKLL